MEFLTGNILDTSTMLTIDSGTLTMNNLFNPDKTKQWVSQGYNDDSITSSITITFAQTTTIDRIALKEHNLKEFKIFYDGATANTFNLLSGLTSTLDLSTNSNTANYFNCSPVECSSITLDMKTTQYPNSEKAIGYLFVGECLLEFPRIPSAKNYQIAKKVIRINHSLSDGGTRQQKISEKWEAKMKLTNIDQDDVSDLENIYNRKQTLAFAPFGTMSSWSGILFECVWVGDFDFWEYSDNAQDAGFEGGISLKETPW